jgi:uncharacterized repeat protein (TIGR03847 family)
MADKEIDLHPITHITADAIGPPGKRVFYIQAWQDDRTISLIVEKFQLQSLAVAYEQFLVELHNRYPDLPEVSSDYDEDKMHIHPPVDPLFRIGEIGLGYEEENDLVVLIANEVVPEDAEPEERQVVRFWGSRAQIHALCRWGVEVSSRGRPTCPQCGQPEEPEGHFCPKKNGHQKSQ